MRSSRSLVLVATVAVLALTLSGCLLGKKSGRSPLSPSAGNGSAVVKGVVRNTDGQPLSDVNVRIQGTSLQAKTDVGGSFELSGAPAGAIGVEFTKTQYQFTVKNIQASGSQAVLANVTLSPLDATLHNGWLVAKGYTGKCGSCHKLHTGTEVASPSLVTAGTVNDTCFTCHNGTNRGTAKTTYDATGHSPAQLANSSTVPVWTGMAPGERGNCTTCHEPHGASGTRVMLRGGSTSNANGLCQTCHTADGTNNTKRWPGWAGYAKTTNLHYNPPMPGNSTLKTYPGTSYAAGECLNCHVPHGTTDNGVVTPAMTRGKEEKLCIKCHTGFAARIAAGATVRHKCSLCHNPHLVESGKKWITQPGTDRDLRITDTKKDSYRGATLLSDSYCTACHVGGNSYGAPLYANSKFKDIRYSSSSQRYDLHAVHLAGLNQGSSGSLDHASWTPNQNRLRCNDCHDVHPTLGPGGYGKMLLTSRTTRVTLATNANGTGYNGKAGCSTAYPCHYDSYYASNTWRGDTQQSCDWCHATTGAGTGSPGYACSPGSDHSTYHYGGLVVFP